MSNPWLKKNPFMSMWLSGANKVVGAARGVAAAAFKREATRASKEAAAEATKRVFEVGSAAAAGVAPKPKAKPRPTPKPGPKPKVKAKARKRR